MQDILKNTLEAYLHDSLTDYALMITGPWGAGKTYHWKHVAVDQIKSWPAKTPKWRTAYISLFGITSSETLHSSIFFSLLPKLASKSAKLLARASKFIPPKLKQYLPDTSQLKLRPGDWSDLTETIICFDDLERCRMPMETVLGHINQYVEQHRAKVVVICNEDKIYDQEKEAYVRLKEKVFGRTVRFVCDAVSGRAKPATCGQVKTGHFKDDARSS